MQIILLIGVTGSGKSTIFNFLAGAEFFIDNKELKIKNKEIRFSQMTGGMKSITKDPNFYYNIKSNHMIIDFPGFNDTNGELDQLLFQLLFHKIVTSGPIKIAYVIKNPESSLPNRGSDLQEFIRNLNKNANMNIQKFNLFLNCYLEELLDQDLKKNIQQELNSVNLSQVIEKILILRKAKTDEDVSKVFNINIRENLWKEFEFIQSFQIQPIKLPKTEIISDYLRKTTLSTVANYGNTLSYAFYQNIQKLNHSDRKTALQSLRQLYQFSNQRKRKILQVVCEQLASIFKIKNDSILQIKNDSMENMRHFKTIFTYFSQFSQFISGYDDVEITQSIAENKLQQLEQTLEATIQHLRKAEEDEAKIEQINKNNQQLQENRKNKQHEVLQITNQLKNVETLSQKQIQENKQQIQNLEREKAQMMELLKGFQTQLKNISEEHQIQIKQMQSKIQELLNRPPQIEYVYRYRNKGSFCQLI